MDPWWILEVPLSLERVSCWVCVWCLCFLLPLSHDSEKSHNFEASMSKGINTEHWKPNYTCTSTKDFSFWCFFPQSPSLSEQQFKTQWYSIYLNLKPEEKSNFCQYSVAVACSPSALTAFHHVCQWWNFNNCYSLNSWGALKRFCNHCRKKVQISHPLNCKVGP